MRGDSGLGMLSFIHSFNMLCWQPGAHPALGEVSKGGVKGQGVPPFEESDLGPMTGDSATKEHQVAC